MKRIIAIAGLTLREGIRMRVVVVFVVVLLALMLALPFTLRGDDTVSGRLRNFLDYSLGALGLLLSLATVFLSCASITNEIRDRTMHLVVSKPVSRFQILVGKWLGVNLLNILMLALCGAAIYGFATLLAGRPEQFARDRLTVRDVVWTARVAGRPETPDVDKLAEEAVEQQLKEGRIRPEQRAQAFTQIRDEMRSRLRTIPPSYSQAYMFRNLPIPEKKGEVIQVRYRVRATPMPMDEMADVEWQFLDPTAATPEEAAPLGEPVMTRERSGDLHQFLAGSGVIFPDPETGKGKALLMITNPLPPDRSNRLYFDGNDSLEILYKVSTFESNFLKTLLIILLRLALISAIGVFFSIFVSFPVAALCTSAFYFICFGMGFWLEAIGANDAFTTTESNIDPYGKFGPYVRPIMIPLLQFFFPDFGYYSGAARLVGGEFIGWPLIGQCTAHTLLYGGAVLLILGWFIFRRREVAEVTV